MDLDNEELRELVKKNLELTEENHRILKSMRSSARWGRFFAIVWWLIIVAISTVTYYYYIQPYVEQARQLYSQFEQNGQQARDFGAEFANFFKQFKSQQ